MAKDYGRYIVMITDMFQPCMDSENGDFRRLPFEGDVLDQPYMSMQVLKLIQLNYRKHLDKQVKQMKMKGRTR